MSLEDRHSVSDPRPVDNTPSWEVNILRDGSVIVDTIILNNSTLPPRKNKRGKVLWRLPDSLDRTPAFGTDDRKRILDIHKERKKKRKQEKKKRGSTASVDSDRLDSNSTINSSTTSPVQTTSDKSGVSNGTPTRRGKYDRQNKTKSTTTNEEDIAKKSKENGKISDDINDRPKAQDDSSPENGDKVQKKKKKNAASQWRANRGGSFSKEKEPPQTNGGAHSSSITTPQQLPPPGLDLSTSTQSSNGSNHESSSADQFEEQTNQFTQMYPEALGSSNIPDPSCISLEEAKADVSKSSEVTATQPTEEIPATLSSQTSSTQPPKPLPPSDALFIVVPNNERPESLPGQPDISIAVPAARHFISKYYAHFDGTLPGAQIGDLIRYYTTKAQKSVSIGGAHSVVTGTQDIAAQIQSLAGAAFVVRGVVAQDTADGNGVHILVTGTARTGALGGLAVNFAHSVSLVPIEAPMNGNGNSICPALREALELGLPFQIHNDAIALLSGDVGPAAAPIPPQPIQKPPTRPPGFVSWNVS